jgi:endonuclease/exonuclease/phosphatase family metal-dependent hydrolase
MVFNIEEGGEGVDFAQVVGAIRHADPDIVALEEAVGHASRIATELGWPYASMRTQVISRLPIVDVPEGDDQPVFVEVGRGRFVAIDNVHLPAEPYGPESARQGGTPAEVTALEHRIRLPAIERRLARLRPLAATGMPVVMLGDFNAPSHLDWTTAAIGLRPHVRHAIEWPVSRAIEAAGFSDAWRAVHPDPVRDPGLTWWADRPPTGGYEPGADTPDDRIDHIHVAGPIRVIDAVLIGESGRSDVAIGIDPWPSDHRAVLARLTVAPAPLPDLSDTFLAAASSTVALPTGPVTIETTKGVYAVGEPIEVQWASGPAYRWDWIAIYDAPDEGLANEGLADRQRIWLHTRAHIDGTLQLDGAAAIVDQSSIGGRWPLPPGRYVAIYLLDDGPIALGRAAFTIAD